METPFWADKKKKQTKKKCQLEQDETKEKIFKYLAS
jgi:hypothetical protein